MANADNLKGKGFESRTTKEVRKIAKKGGIKSGEARRKKRTMREGAKMLLELQVPTKLKQRLKKIGVDKDDATYQMAILVAITQEALKGNVRAAQFISNISGNDPKLDLQKEELKIKQRELEYKKQKDVVDEQERDGLADIIQKAYESRQADNEK